MVRMKTYMIIELEMDDDSDVQATELRRILQLTCFQEHVGFSDPLFGKLIYNSKFACDHFPSPFLFKAS